MEDIVKNEFQFYCKLAKPLVLNLPKSKDRILAAAWIKKFMDVNCGEELLRTTYLKLLLFCLQRRKLTGIFSDDPAEYDILEVLPAGLDLNELARNLLDQEKTERKERIRQEMMGDMAVFPAYTTDCSRDLTEYVAAQDIPNFGVHAFYAISNQPVNKWQLPEKAILPKGVKSAIEITATTGPAGLDATCVCGPKGAASSPEVEGEEGDCRKKKDASPEKKKRKPKKLGQSPPTHPIGEVKHTEEDRMPPTWGTNLLDVMEFTDVGKVDEPTEEEVKLDEQVSKMLEDQQDEEDADEDEGSAVDIKSKTAEMLHIIDEFKHGKLDKSKAPPSRLKKLGDKSGIKMPKSTKAPKIPVKGMKKKKGKGGKGGYGPKPPNLPEEFADWDEKDLEEAGLTWADLMPLDDDIDAELQRIEDEGMGGSDMDDDIAADLLPGDYEGLTDYDAMIREAEADLEAHKTTYDVGVEEDEPIIELFDDEIEELDDELNLSRAAEEMKTTSPALTSGIPVTTPRRSATPRRSRSPEKAFAEEEDVLLKQRISPLRAPKEITPARKKASIVISPRPKPEGAKDQNMSQVFKEAKEAFNDGVEPPGTPAGVAGPSRRRTGQTPDGYNSDYDNPPTAKKPSPQRFPKAKRIKKKGKYRPPEPEQDEFERLERQFADEECQPCSPRQQLGSPSPGADQRVRHRAQQQEQMLQTPPDPDYEQFSRQYGDAGADLMGEEPCPPCDSPPQMTEEEEFEFMESMYGSPDRQSTRLYSPTSGVELPIPDYNYGPGNFESPGRSERERQDVLNRAMVQELSLRQGSPQAQEIIDEAEAGLMQDRGDQSLLQESPPPGLAISPQQLSPRQGSPRRDRQILEESPPFDLARPSEQFFPRQSTPPGGEMAGRCRGASPERRLREESPPPGFDASPSPRRSPTGGGRRSPCRGAQQDRMIMQESPPAAYGSPPPLSPPPQFPEGMENPWADDQYEFDRLERQFADDEECKPCSPRQQLDSPSPGAAQRVRQRAQQQEDRLRTPPGGYRILEESPPAAYRSPPPLSPRGPPMPFPEGVENPWGGVAPRNIFEESPPRGFDDGEVCGPCGPAPGTGQYFPPGFDVGADSPDRPPMNLQDRPRMFRAEYDHKRRVSARAPNINVGSKKRDRWFQRRRIRPAKCSPIQDYPFREQYEAEYGYTGPKLPARGLSPWRNEPRPSTPPRQLPEPRPAGYRTPFAPGVSSPRTPPCQRPEPRPDDFQSPFSFGYIGSYQPEERYEPLDDTLPPEEVEWEDDRLLGAGISEAELAESRRFKYPEGFVPMDSLPADEDYWTEDMLAGGGLADVGGLEDVLPPDSPCTPCEERERPKNRPRKKKYERDDGSPRRSPPKERRARRLFADGDGGEPPCEPCEGPQVITIKSPVGPQQVAQGYTPPGVAGPSRRRTGQTPVGYNSDFEDSPPRPSPGPQQFPKQKRIKKKGRRPPTPERKKQSPCGTCAEEGDVIEDDILESSYVDTFNEILYANLQLSPSQYPPPRAMQRPPPPVCSLNPQERFGTQGHLARNEAFLRAYNEGNLSEHLAQRDMQDLADKADHMFDTDRGMFDESPPREVFQGNYYPEILDAADALMKTLSDYDFPDSPSPSPPRRTAPAPRGLPPPGPQTAGPCSRRAGPPSRIAGPPSRIAAPGSRIPPPGSRIAAPSSRMAAPPSRMAPPGSRIAAPPSRLAPPGSRIAGPPSRMPGPPSRMPPPPSRMPAPPSRIAAPPSRIPPPGSRIAAPPGSRSRPPSAPSSRTDIGPCGVCKPGSAVAEKPSRRGIPQPRQLRETKSSQMRKDARKKEDQQREKAARDAEEKKRHAGAKRQAAQDAKRAESMARVGERLPGGRIRPPDYAHAGGTGRAVELSAEKVPTGYYYGGDIQPRRLFPSGPSDYIAAGGTGPAPELSAQKRTEMRYRTGSALPRKKVFGPSKIGRPPVCQPCDDNGQLAAPLRQSPGFAGELRQHKIDFPRRREAVVVGRGRKTKMIRRRSDTAIDHMDNISEEERSPCTPFDIYEDEDEYAAALREMGMTTEEAARIFDVGDLEEGDYDDQEEADDDEEGRGIDEANEEMEAFERNQDEFWNVMSEDLTDEELREIGITRPSAKKKSPCGTCDSGSGPSRAPKKKKLTKKDEEMLAQLQQIEERANALLPREVTEYDRIEQAVIQREQEEREYFERMMRGEQAEDEGYEQGSPCKGRRKCGRDY